MDTTGTIFLPPSGSTISNEVDGLFYFIFYVSIVFFMIVTIGSAYFIWKYRRRDGQPGRTSGVDHNTTLEVLWTAIPVLLIIVVFIWGFKSYLKMHVIPGDAMEIKATAQKWFWSFDYPEGVTTVNELVVPEGQPIKLLMSSQDVIHSFFVPVFRIKMDVLPNRYTSTWFEATRRGEYDLFCAEYCGTKHSEMIGKVRVVSESEYNKWIEEGSGPAEGETMADYGKKLYVSRACNTCHSIDGSKIVGPTFLDRFGATAVFVDGSSAEVDENYLRESILNPQTKVVAGYDPVMPTYQGLLKDRDVDALIAYIKSLSAGSGSE